MVVGNDVKLDAVENVRSQPGAALVLYLTDRCPVGCRHCSVDARFDSPTISDWELFDGLLREICNSQFSMVGITGGEPFSERRGLEMSVEALHDAGKSVILYTSGYWAGPQLREWQARVLRRVDTAFLSTDIFHQPRIRNKFSNAVRHLSTCDVDTVVQYLGPIQAQISETLQDAGGVDRVEFNEIVPLSVGRGAEVFSPGKAHALKVWGRCHLLTAPTIRYDGRVSACCHEPVIKGGGPDRLRRSIQAEGAMQAVADFQADPVLQVLREHGLRYVASHPRLAGDGERTFPSICSGCWFAIRTLEGTPNQGSAFASGLLAALDQEDVDVDSHEADA